MSPNIPRYLIDVVIFAVLIVADFSTQLSASGIKLVIWDADQYLLTVANLWANEISSNPPELRKLNIS